MAQLVGAAVGTALEGYTAANLARVFGPITSYPRPPNTYNDDITFELAFLEAFSRAGYAVTSTDIAAEWTALIPMGWSAEAIALANIRRGVEPPYTGIEDNPFDEWIGAQMRGVICGMVAPGRAREAARLAWLDGQVSHTSNGILGEVFNAVLAARAFGGGDMRSLVETTVALMPAASEYGMVVRNALAACKTSDDWQSAGPAAMPTSSSTTGSTPIPTPPRRSSRCGSAATTSTGPGDHRRHRPRRRLQCGADPVRPRHRAGQRQHRRQMA